MKPTQPVEGALKRRRPRERATREEQYEADFIDDTEVIVHRKAGAAKTTESGFYVYEVGHRP